MSLERRTRKDRRRCRLSTITEGATSALRRPARGCVRAARYVGLLERRAACADSPSFLPSGVVRGRCAPRPAARIRRNAGGSRPIDAHPPAKPARTVSEVPEAGTRKLGGALTLLNADAVFAPAVERAAFADGPGDPLGSPRHGASRANARNRDKKYVEVMDVRTGFNSFRAGEYPYDSDGSRSRGTNHPTQLSYLRRNRARRRVPRRLRELHSGVLRGALRGVWRNTEERKWARPAGTPPTGKPSGRRGIALGERTFPSPQVAYSQRTPTTQTVKRG